MESQDKKTEDRKADLGALTIWIPILWFLGSIGVVGATKAWECLDREQFKFWIWICIGGLTGSTLPWSKLLLIKLFQGRAKWKECGALIVCVLIQAFVFIMIAYPSIISDRIKITPISFLILLGSWFLTETLMQAEDGLEHDDLKRIIKNRK